jgi:2-C-methyl-D-erythritol 2,4-cyclodiphosphate synthase/2-C-methyl-D-erythritol 4-phosphate cytidylyltransferase
LKQFISAIIVGAGQSTRMGSCNKITMRLVNGKTVIETCLEPFICSKLIDEIIIVASKELLADFKNQFESKCIKVVEGGKTRFDSVLLGAAATNTQSNFLCIHDAARPFATKQFIENCLVAALESGAAVPVLNSEDTLKTVNKNFIKKTLDRNKIFRVQTPQVFKRIDYMQAASIAKKQKIEFTDDSHVFEIGASNQKIQIIQGEKSNIKITTYEDLLMIQKVENPTFRIGHGYDVHRLMAERKLILGGVDINYNLGLEGHSDADVLIHAIIDSILGAGGFKDIGEIFPTTDEKYKNISSLKLLGQIKKLLENNKLAVVNIDATIVAQTPSLAPFITQMKQNIAKSLNCLLNQVNVKATTEEGLGFTGCSNGIAAHAVCLLQSFENK